MSSKTLCRLVRFATISTAFCGLIILLYVVPAWGQSLITANPHLQSWYYPWLIFAWLISLPCFLILALVWKVSAAVKREQVFTMTTAKDIQTAAIVLFADVGLFFAGNILLMILNLSDPGTLFVSLLIGIFGIALALLASVLSRYISKAAVLQQESDGTI